MNREIRDRMFRGACPFHNKVLRFNYDLPLEQLSSDLTTILLIIQRIYPGDEVLKTEDRQEWDQMLTKHCEKMSFEGLLEVTRDTEKLYHFGYESPWIRVGLFNNKMDWYLRLFLEKDEHLSKGERRCGNLELYAAEDVILSAQKALEGCLGHLIAESARKYVEENLTDL